MQATEDTVKPPKPEVDPRVARLWSLPMDEAEGLYVEAFRRNDHQALRWLARNDRYFLLTCILRRPDAREPWLYNRCREVEADPNDRIDVWAREHYKSTIITFAGVVQEILKDPEITTCIFSHDKPTAKAFVKQVKLEFEENKLLQQLFPDILWANPKKEAPWWSEDAGIVVKRKGNPKEATLEASGLVDGMATGSHFRLRVYDDVVTETTVTTKEMIKKVTEQYDLSQNLGTRGGRIWVIGTRYHFGDTYGVIMNRGVLKERRYAATDNGDFDGTPIYLTQEEWDRKLKEGQRKVIAAQMLQNPLAGSEATFRISWLKFWEIRPKRINVYILCDPSKGRTEESDNTAIGVIGIDVAGNKYLLDGWCQLTSLSKRWQLLRDCHRRWSRMEGVQAVFIGYEQFGMQTDLEHFEGEMEREDYYFSVEELAWPREGKKSKQYRIERLEPDFKSGRFKLPGVVSIDNTGHLEHVDIMKKSKVQEVLKAGERWRVASPLTKLDQDDKIYDVMARFLEEFMFFPFAPTDDFLDMLSRIYDMDPQPPRHYSEEPGDADSTAPEVFADM